MTQAEPTTPGASPEFIAPVSALPITEGAPEVTHTDAKLNESTPSSLARCGLSPPPKVSKTIVSHRCDIVERNRVKIGAP
jgi:hypothetical protein